VKIAEAPPEYEDMNPGMEIVGFSLFATYSRGFAQGVSSHT
jgi:hypothetical protein